jgi:hypothetical protein
MRRSNVVTDHHSRNMKKLSYSTSMCFFHYSYTPTQSNRTMEATLRKIEEAEEDLDEAKKARDRDMVIALRTDLAALRAELTELRKQD